MSILETYAIGCACGATLEVRCCVSLDAARDPQLRDQLLARTLHLFPCGACGRSVVVEATIAYLDLARRQFYRVAPDHERGDERRHADELVAAWRLAFGELAPVSVAAVFATDRFHVRLCFGLEELREKVVARDAGLDDLALEVYKAELLARNPAWASSAIRTLRLDHVEPDGRLAFWFERAADPMIVPEVGIVADRDRYEHLAATPWRQLVDAWPGIASGPCVSVLRVAG
jgi:hypothetical protein